MREDAVPDLDNAEAFLLDFHARFAGATSDAMSHCARDGRSPYDVLAALVPDTAKPLTVLDLACGDGALLQLLARREQQGLHLVGVDMSPHELARARANLPPQVELRLERAQQLSLDEASVDCVLCSLALMLMDPLDPVVGSIARVLKPGGIFAALVGGDMVRGDAWEAFTDAAKSLLAEEGALPPSLGDSRTRTAHGLASVFSREAGFGQPVSIEDIVLHLDGSVEEVKQSLMLTYFVGMLSPRGVAELSARTDAILQAGCRADGTVPCSLGVRLLRCVRRRT
jgi:SAM-dependent methyltransferase